MNTLFILIFLLSVPLLIVGLIKPSIFKLQSRKSAGLAFGGLFIVSFILFGVTSTPSEEIVTQNTKTPSIASNEVKAEVKPATLEDRIKPLVVKIGTTEVTYKGIDDEKTDPDRPTGSRMITVKLSVTKFYSASALYKNTGELTAKVFQETYTSNPNVYDVIVWYYGDTKDRYGNTNNDVIISYAIDKKTYQKINWSNFDSTKLCDFLKSEASINGGETTCVALANIK